MSLLLLCQTVAAFVQPRVVRSSSSLLSAVVEAPPTTTAATAGTANIRYERKCESACVGFLARGRTAADMAGDMGDLSVRGVRMVEEILSYILLESHLTSIIPPSLYITTETWQ